MSPLQAAQLLSQRPTFFLAFPVWQGVFCAAALPTASRSIESQEMQLKHSLHCKQSTGTCNTGRKPASPTLEPLRAARARWLQRGAIIRMFSHSNELAALATEPTLLGRLGLSSTTDTSASAGGGSRSWGSHSRCLRRPVSPLRRPKRPEAYQFVARLNQQVASLSPFLPTGMPTCQHPPH